MIITVNFIKMVPSLLKFLLIFSLWWSCGNEGGNFFEGERALVVMRAAPSYEKETARKRENTEEERKNSL